MLSYQMMILWRPMNPEQSHQGAAAYSYSFNFARVRTLGDAVHKFPWIYMMLISIR